jgi:hypothetical protein
MYIDSSSCKLFASFERVPAVYYLLQLLKPDCTRLQQGNNRQIHNSSEQSRLSVESPFKVLVSTGEFQVAKDTSINVDC